MRGSIRGRPRQSDVDARIRAALRVLGDPTALERSSLAKRPIVQRLASTQFRGRTCAEGLALAHVLRHALAQIARDLDGVPVAKLAAALRDGRSQVDAAADLGITDEYLCRRWKPVLVTLVRERLEVLDSRSNAPSPDTSREPEVCQVGEPSQAANGHLVRASAQGPRRNIASGALQ